MELEEGKFYRTKSGRKVGPMRKQGPTWDHVGCLQVWQGDGRVMAEIGDESHDYIVAEWEDDTPKLWRDMTPEEKGALLLAHHEGQVIEFMPDDQWVALTWEFDWIGSHAYRVRPEPKQETATFYWCLESGSCFKNPYHSTTSRITLPLTDGTVPAGVYLNTDGRAIVVEELEKEASHG